MRIFQFDSFKQFPELIHGVATAEFGNMSFNWGEKGEVQANRRRFFQELDVPENQVVVASLLHGHQIIDISEQDRGRGIRRGEDSLESDVLATQKPNTFLFMVVADCLALFYYDPVKRVCALAHAGWKGVDQNVPQLTVEYLEKKYGSNPADIRIGMSPALQAQSACFTPPLEQEAKADWHPYLHRQGDKVCADIGKFAYDQLVTAGIKPNHIERSLIDTRKSPEYFSHRRSAEEKAPEARFGCLIGLRI